MLAARFFQLGIALQKCTRCSTKFYGSACPSCGGSGVATTDTKTVAGAIGCLGTIAIIVVLALGLFRLDSNSPNQLPSAETPRAPLSRETESLIEDLTKKNLIRIESGERKGYVNPDFWMQLDASKKEILVEAMAAKCASDKGDSMASIDVFDAQSARKIAEFGPFSGFKAY